LIAGKVAPLIIDGKRYYRSELLGRTYVFSILESLNQRILDDESLISNLRREYDFEEDWEGVLKNRIETLMRIGAIRSNKLLTQDGKNWFSLLYEMNLTLPKRPIEVIYQDIPGTFLKKYVLGEGKRSKLLKIVIVSPWLSKLGNGNLLGKVSNFIKNEQIRTLIISRPPVEKWHEEALEILLRGGAEIYINEGVHSKIYICKFVDRSKNVAIIGSANLTKPARFDNIEVGIIIKGITNSYSTLIENLLTSAYDLKTKKWKY